MTQMSKGKLFVIEGLDGSGKETQTKLLVDMLRLRFPTKKIVNVSFPNYGNPSASLVEAYLRGEFNESKEYYKQQGRTYEFVMNISRFYAIDRLATFLQPNNEGKTLFELYDDGAIIICDRYYTSNQLHQSAFIEQQDVHRYVKAVEYHETHDLGIPKPDKVLFLKTTPEISVQNITKRYDGKKKEDIHENISHLTDVLRMRDVIIDAQAWNVIECMDLTNTSMLPIDVIAKTIADTVVPVIE